MSPVSGIEQVYVGIMLQASMQQARLFVSVVPDIGSTWPGIVGCITQVPDAVNVNVYCV